MVDRAKKITELTAVTSITNNDVFIVVTNTAGVATTKKITINNFRAGLPPIVVGIANNTALGTVIVANNLTVNATGHVSLSSNVTVSDRLSVTGETYLTGNVYLGISAADNASELIHFYGTVFSNVIPHTPNNYQLGNTTNYWSSVTTAAVSVGNLTISNTDVRSTNGGLVNIFGSNFAQLQWSDVANTLATDRSGNTTLVYTENNFAGMEVIQQGITKAALFMDTNYVQLVVNSSPLTFKGTAGIPANAASTGTAGDIAFDSNYIYYCVATNTWKRVALSTWP